MGNTLINSFEKGRLSKASFGVSDEKIALQVFYGLPQTLVISSWIEGAVEI